MATVTPGIGTMIHQPSGPRGFADDELQGHFQALFRLRWRRPPGQSGFPPLRAPAFGEPLGGVEYVWIVEAGIDAADHVVTTPAGAPS